MEAVQGGPNVPKQRQSSKAVKALLVIFNSILMAVGAVGGPILTRLYFLHGGKRKWLTAWLLTAGFPILIVPIAISYARARTKTSAKRLLVTQRLAAGSAILGFLLGFDGYLYSFGMSYLPVSVASLLGSTQLAFTAVFAYLIVKHKFTHYSINSVVLMTFGSIILGLHMNSDRPTGESDSKYFTGFFVTLAAAALHGLLMPAVEYNHMKAGTVVTFDLVLQVQFLVSMFATLFCSIPMIINKDFQAITKEAREFEFGETKYYTILASAAILLQFLIIGNLGLIFCSTSLLGGIVNTLLVPIQQAFAVIFLPESFNVEKGLALAMCLWGFASYFYGEYEVSHKNIATKQEPEKEEV